MQRLARRRITSQNIWHSAMGFKNWPQEPPNQAKPMSKGAAAPLDTIFGLLGGSLDQFWKAPRPKAGPMFMVFGLHFLKSNAIDDGSSPNTVYYWIKKLFVQKRSVWRGHFSSIARYDIDVICYSNNFFAFEFSTQCDDRELFNGQLEFRFCVLFQQKCSW